MEVAAHEQSPGRHDTIVMHLGVVLPRGLAPPLPIEAHFRSVHQPRTPASCGARDAPRSPATVLRSTLPEAFRGIDPTHSNAIGILYCSSRALRKSASASALGTSVWPRFATRNARTASPVSESGVATQTASAMCSWPSNACSISVG